MLAKIVGLGSVCVLAVLIITATQPAVGSPGGSAAAPIPSDSASPTVAASGSPSASPTNTVSPTSSPSETVSPSASPTVLGRVTTSLIPHPPTLRAGTPLSLTGTIRAGGACFPPYTVTIERRGVNSSTYRAIATVIAGADQTWTFRTAGRYNVAYRAFVTTAGCSGPPSKPAPVLVKARIHVHDVSHCRSPQPVTGWVQPKRSREWVVLQSRGRRRWRTIRRDMLDRHSRFALLAPFCDRIYRLVWPVQDVRNEKGRLIFKLR